MDQLLSRPLVLDGQQPFGILGTAVGLPIWSNRYLGPAVHGLPKLLMLRVHLDHILGSGSVGSLIGRALWNWLGVDLVRVEGH